MYVSTPGSGLMWNWCEFLHRLRWHCRFLVLSRDEVAALGLAWWWLVRLGFIRRAVIDIMRSFGWVSFTSCTLLRWWLNCDANWMHCLSVYVSNSNYPSNRSFCSPIIWWWAALALCLGSRRGGKLMWYSIGYYNPKNYWEQRTQDGCEVRLIRTIDGREGW